MKSDRPINLQLTTLKFPPMAIVSILHRLSGLFLVITIPVLLCLLSYSLRSEADFVRLKHSFSLWPVKGVVWLVLLALCYHTIAGIRHLIMDIGWADSLAAGRNGAFVVLILTVISAVLLGVWLW